MTGNHRGPTGYYRVIRGGNWRALAKVCRSADRGLGDPEALNDATGFRLVSSD